MKVRIYRTMEGDRWDTIAFKTRGNAYDYIDIIELNYSYQGVYILPSGLDILIPVKEPVRTKILPPWKKK